MGRGVDTIQNITLTSAQKLTQASVIYRTEPKNKKVKEKKLKAEIGYAQK